MQGPITPDVANNKRHRLQFTHRHHPRKRVIQYSRAFAFIISALEYWVARSSRAMTAEYGTSFSRHTFARAFQIALRPQNQEGAGKTGCALHPRSRVHLMLWKNAHTSIQVQRKHSGLPCAMVLRIIRDLPGGRAVPPSPARCASIIANLTPALGRQDHAISPYESHATSSRNSRPSLPAPNVS